MKPRFKVGQRVCVIRASSDWDAPVGALGTVASYDGANYRGTDWEVGFLRDGAEVCEPAWPIDEGCLVEAGPGAFEPLAFEDQCLAADGSWSDSIVTYVGLDDPADRDARLAQAVAVLRPLLGGEPLATDFRWHPRTDGGDLLTLITAWCACRPWLEIIPPLRRRFAESNWIADDGWLVEMCLDREAAQALLGPDLVDFRFFVVELRAAATRCSLPARASAAAPSASRRRAVSAPQGRAWRATTPRRPQRSRSPPATARPARP